MAPPRYESGDLVLEVQDNHAPGVTPHQREELCGELESDRLLPVYVTHIVAQIVMNIKYQRCRCSIGGIYCCWAVLPMLHSHTPGGCGTQAQWPRLKKGSVTASV